MIQLSLCGERERSGLFLYLLHLYLEGSFATFTDLPGKNNLPQSHMLWYFQEGNFACTHFTSFPRLPPGSLVIEVLSQPKAHGRILILCDLILSSEMASLAGIGVIGEGNLSLM